MRENRFFRGRWWNTAIYSILKHQWEDAPTDSTNFKNDMTMVKSGWLTEFLHQAGWRYWTASLLPGLVGTTLPFWLLAPGLPFRWSTGIAFLMATVLCQAGFSLLQGWFYESERTRWTKSGILGAAGFCIMLACILGLAINRNISLKQSVYENIFLVFGILALFVGVLYVVPPLSFSRRSGGEIVLSYSLGLLPVLGAFLVQAGDLIRRVYLAALPVMVVTAIWVWIEELGNREEDDKTGRATLVTLFGARFSGRYVVLALAMAYFATLILAVVSGSLSPIALITLLLVGLLWRIVTVSWNMYASTQQMRKLRKHAFILHLATCSIMAISSLAAAFT